MKNRLSDLNNHLFMQLERLNDENLTGDDLVEELNRSQGIANVSAQIISVGALALKAKTTADNSLNSKFKLPEMFEG